MRNILALVGAALVTFAVVGWYRGWYQVETEPGPGGKSEVKIDINGPKIEKDLHQGTQKLENALEKKAQSPAAPQAVQLAPPTGPVPGGPPAPPPSYWAPTPQGETYVLPPASPSLAVPQVPRSNPN